MVCRSIPIAIADRHRYRYQLCCVEMLNFQSFTNSRIFFSLVFFYFWYLLEVERSKRSFRDHQLMATSGGVLLHFTEHLATNQLTTKIVEVLNSNSFACLYFTLIYVQFHKKVRNIDEKSSILEFEF